MSIILLALKQRLICVSHPDDAESLPLEVETPDELTGEVEVVTAVVSNGDFEEDEEEKRAEQEGEEEEDEEEILTLGDSNPEENIAPCEGLDIGVEAAEEEDTDPGYEIVTEDRGTNCPSLSGSLRKMPRLKALGKAGEDDINEVEEETAPASGLPPAAPKRQNKRWSKLMKYTLPSKTPETKTKKENKERKSLKDKMKENDFVVFLTERRAVSESRFRVLDKIGSPGKLTRTKSDQVVRKLEKIETTIIHLLAEC